MARPSYKPTAAARRRVAIAAGSGTMSHEEIAIGLGISRNTLEKHFEAELSAGAYRKRLEVLEAMHAAARKGNVAAAREYLKTDPRVSAPPLPEGDGETKAPKLGKKEQAQADAVQAGQGTEWGELLPRGGSTLQ